MDAHHKFSEKRGEIFKHQGSTAINEPLCIWNSSQRGISKPKNPGGNIQWQPQTTIVSCYHPANLSEETDASVFFYSLLQDATRQLPKHNVILVAGDMKARVGTPDIKGYSFHDKNKQKQPNAAGLVERV